MMKTPLLSTTLGVAVAAALASPIALAQDAGWYGGIGIGQSRAKIDDGRIAADLLGAGTPATSIKDDDRSIGFKLFGGRKFNRNFAVEGGYFRLGEFGFTATTATGNLDGTIKMQGLNLDAVGILPFTEKFSGLGRVGLTYVQTQDAFRSTGAVVVTDPNPSKSAGSFKLGLGVQYDLTRSMGLRGEWERYRVSDAVGNMGNIDMLLVGLVYRFGGDEPAAKAQTPPLANSLISLTCAAKLVRFNR